MKLRIKGNTIRLRLSQGEVHTFWDQGSVSDFTVFDPITQYGLTYELRYDRDTRVVSAVYKEGRIQVNVPPGIAEEWATTEQVGFQNEEIPGEEFELHILVEKDFQCLHKRPNEDETDNFPNPLA
ncbi:DUF7009 family protein [Robertkochia solimangrovi]|uniref:DUF7009 family protein n=1 Tax=Robertkochia solimangrovi TaxID=2213046 RepID=UPI00117DED87|nr:hypothetical protein [Robertkochia solimangrovi]TRZ42279.1 hypothetical protein DMZ48_14720 [Robertkochia solimangrovi]